MTKEEIIGQFSAGVEYGEYYEHQIDQMMDQYAKQEAIGFVEWINKSGWVPNSSGYWFEHQKDRRDLLFHTTDELYTQYLSQHTQSL